MPKKSTSKSAPKFQACTVCGYPRKFVEYRTKAGSDGRVARWPQYEDCPNRGDLALHPRSKVNRIHTELLSPEHRASADRVIQRKPMPHGKLYQVVDIGQPLASVADCLVDYAERWDRLPLAVGVNPEETAGLTAVDVDWDDRPASIPIWRMKSLTPGYGYIFLVSELRS